MTQRRRAIPYLMPLCALVLSSFSVSPARADDSAAVAAPKPSKVMTVGTMRVEKYGAGSPAMIFVPGLSCGSWVWDGAVSQYAGKHAVYIVTLAGFDGVPPATGNLIDGAESSLAQLITTENLNRPIVVGHSLGGFLSLKFGIDHAALVRGIVAVDGLPVLPPFSQMTADQRNTTVDMMTTQMKAAPSAQFLAQQKATLTTMITSPADVARVATLSAKSDQGATAEYFGELSKTDLRPDLAKLTVPTLEIAPVPTVPQPYEGPQASAASMADRETGYKGFYTSLFPGAPNVTVVTVPNSKHFVMIDQPKALFDAITSFVSTLPA